MAYDPWSLYRDMLHSRRFEEAVLKLWAAGAISGEMHLGSGEEAIVAGVNAHLVDGDALALDHRGTPPLLMRGVDRVALLRELLGHPQGLCGGQGGHMHLFWPERLVASSGIVGAAGPAACGFALAGQQLRPGTLAVAYFGDGAMNQGMLMESMNLAAAWRLPVLFVCKDDGWAITTRSDQVTGGDLLERARGLGLHAEAVNGLEVEEVWPAAERAVARARAGEGPTFLRARCVHLEGHFLGDLMLRSGRDPIKEMRPMAGPLMRALVTRGGAKLGDRLSGLMSINAEISRNKRARDVGRDDPLLRARLALERDPDRLQVMEHEIDLEIASVVLAATADLPARAPDAARGREVPA